MLKKVLPILILTALALSACATATASPTTVPTAAATTAVVVDPAVPTPTAAPYTDATTPCKPFNVLEEALAVKLTNLPPVTADDWSQGPENAPVTIIVYSDLQCSHCKTLEGEIVKLLDAYPTQVRVVYRHWLIFNNNDLFAGRAAEAAGLQGKFFEYKEVLFNEQATWSPMASAALDTYLKTKAKDLGLDSAKFESDYNSDALKQKVEGFKTTGSVLGFGGTPSLVINGAYFQDSWQFDVLKIVVELITSGAKAGECPPTVIAAGKTYSTIITTSKGDITLDLFADKAPQAVNSFVYLARSSFYDGNPFYAVTESYVLTGDASGSGYGNAGYAYLDENRAESKFDVEGALGAYNFGAGLNGSIFFITKAALTNLAGRYTTFGKVTAGLDVLKTLVAETDTIISIAIIEK